MAQRKRSYRVPTDPETLAAEWHRLSGEHFSSFNRIRHLCSLRIEKFIELEESIATDDTDLLPSSHEIKSVTQCLAVAIEGERQALGMQYADATVAIEQVKRLGFLVQRPDGSIEVAAEYVADSDT